MCGPSPLTLSLADATHHLITASLMFVVQSWPISSTHMTGGHWPGQPLGAVCTRLGLKQGEKQQTGQQAESRAAD